MGSRLDQTERELREELSAKAPASSLTKKEVIAALLFSLRCAQGEHLYYKNELKLDRGEKAELLGLECTYLAERLISAFEA